MAAALKSYAGSVSTTTTIYTVPTGRSAKVTVSFLRLSPNTEFSIGGVTVFEAHSSTYNLFVGGITSPLTSTSAHTQYQGQQPVYYLSAGQTVIASCSGSQTIDYNIGVVEEAV